ncbi:S4 domain-containing protein [Acetobacteraceae bacterium ESL0709]|nr:S4 domain-containing protein [Acetobacteraceae bacterium ESL0697]MDF7677832.1 S4 domain-containing protein [Acetobacteraceae bacterium ESL0709]
MDSQRLDLWLFYARFAKSRQLCSQYIEKGHMHLNRQRVTKNHAKIRIGDVLTFPSPATPSIVRVWRVEKLGLRRGPAPEASQLYREIHE